MKMRENERGFTLIELLVVMALFATLAVGFYQVMFSSTRGSNVTRSVVRISEEARLAFNRLLRDTRETTRLDAASPTTYSIFVDFDGNRQEPVPVGSPNPAGDYENLVFAWNDSAKTITLNGIVLIRGADCIRSGPSCTTDVFTYSSNKFQYDWNSDGITTWQELDEAGCASRGSVSSVGDCDIPPTLDVERASITNISYAFVVTQGGRSSTFYGEAQLRNRR